MGTLRCSLSGPKLLHLAAAFAARSKLTTHADDSAPHICAIFLTNSAAYVVAVLAALSQGLAFMPLDPSWPPHRLQHVCDEARPAAIVWAPASSSGGHGPPPVVGFPLLQLPPLSELLLLPPAQEADAAEGAAALPAAEQPAQPQGVGQHVQPGEQHPGEHQPQPGKQHSMRCPSKVADLSIDCCYVLYTSGSTGHPLGVCGLSSGVLNRCTWMEQACPFQPGDRVAFKTSPCFVDSIWELFGPLLAGATLVAVPQATGRDPAQLLRLLRNQRITHLAAVPTLWRALAARMRADPAAAASLRLRLAVSSGEPLPVSLLEDLQLLLPQGCRIWNLYGSTEAAADCTAFDCSSWRAQQAQQAQQAQEPLQGQPGQQGKRPQVGKEQQAGQDQQAQRGLQRQQQQEEPRSTGGAGQQPPSMPVGRPISGAVVAVLGPEPAAGAAAAGEEEQQWEAGTVVSSSNEQVPAASWAASSSSAAAAAISQRPVLPVGVLGDVAIAGAVLSAGYLCRSPEAAAAQQRRFIGLPTCRLLEAQQAGAAVVAAPDGLPTGFWQEESTRMFLTGDLGWLDAQGCLHLAGRLDLQVKISGVRVDLSEVEAVLAAHPSVASAAARVWQLPAGPVLEAYAELAAGAELQAVAELAGSLPAGRGAHNGSNDGSSASLRRWCQERLPSAAVPQHVRLLPALPRSAAGKVQRSQLPPPAATLLAAPTAPKPEDASAAGGRAVAVFEAQPQPGKRQRMVAPSAQQAGNGFVPQPPAATTASTPRSPAVLLAGTVSELAVSRAFAAALGHSHFEATTSLFATGGTSLTAAEIAGRVAGGRVEAVFRHPTVRALTRFLNLELAVAAKDASRGRLPAGEEEGSGGNTQGQKQQQQQPQQPLVGPGRPVQQQQQQQQQQQPVQRIQGRHLLAGSSFAGPVPPGPRLQLAWRAKLLQCVDAAPLLGNQEPPAAAAVSTGAMDSAVDLRRQQGLQQQQEGQALGQPAAEGRVYACSHGGDVRCYERGSGREVWQALLPDRADAGMVLCYGAPASGIGPAQQAAQQAQQEAEHQPGEQADCQREQQAGQQQQRAGQQQQRAGQQQQAGQRAQQAQQNQQEQAHQQYVAAATNGGTLFFLDASTGSLAGSLDAGGSIRAPPVCDPWLGLVWQPSHARQLIVAAPPGRLVACLPFPAAVSAAVAFDRGRRLALVCCLDGSLMAVAVQLPEQHEQLLEVAVQLPAQAVQLSQQAVQLLDKEPASASGSGLRLTLAWQWNAGAPLFAPATLAGGTVLAAAVDGSITALSAVDGTLLWRHSVRGALFTPPVMMPTQQLLLVGSQAGQLAALDVSSGRQVAAAELGDAITGLHPLLACAIGAAGPAGREQEQGQGKLLAAVCLAPGVLALVDVAALLSGSSGADWGSDSNGAGPSSGSGGEEDDRIGISSAGRGSGASGASGASCVLDAVQLPGEVYAVPALAGQLTGRCTVAVGCRDDHLYCLVVLPSVLPSS